MSVLKVIEAQMDGLSPADRQIGRYILDNPDEVLRLSSARLAEETGRSQSSVVKFAQKFGFSGYQDMKFAVSKAQAREWRAPGALHSTIELGDSPATVAQKMLSSKMHAMQQTIAANDERDIARVMDLIDTAGRIHVAGVGASSLVARDFCLKLQKLGRYALHDADSHVQMANVSASKAGDVLFALSHSGTSIETVRIAELAEKRGATVVSITGPQHNPIARGAGVTLYTIADEERVRSSAITARDAQLMLTDFLFILLLQRQKDAGDYIADSGEAVTALKLGAEK
ncbi:MurR/RpiR family transcriptional regulator [Martelella lutilitoris]|uniref:MurR/RpiR family transcriptional regulator n=1 Tax=Martelella lutilitoris TaxID=2583532 RepID=A0A5C4JPY3_9HYPH|nr:MurR/RpiR family transcriptional regulator [Martelella lutilitoris]TNB46699.1 MurR/RpiR family transcriptional regulator [Martelella lutilitoris]